MLERILVPLDSTRTAEHVLPYVTLLAKQLRQPVTLLSVVRDGEELNPVVRRHDAAIASLLEQQRAYAQRYLAEVQRQLEEQGVSVMTEVGTGRIAETIVTAATAHQTGLIALATHGRVGPERWFLGSVADNVVRTAPVPVLLIRPREEATIPAASVTHVLLPLDGSSHAEAALPVASFLAQAFAIPVTVIRTVDLTWLYAGAGGAYMGNGGMVSQDLLNTLEADAKQYLDAIAGQLRDRGVATNTQFSFLPPATEITELAGSEPGALIVMSTHGRSGLGRTLLGSVADRVVRSSVAPVLVVRAEA